MPRLRPLFHLILILTFTAFLTPASPAHAQTSLGDLLTPYLARYHLPAMPWPPPWSGMARSSPAAPWASAEPAPKSRSPSMTAFIDSDTKAMTALLAAMLVDEGKLRWDSTVAQVFPELAPNMNPGLRGVTLEQLLSHTSGLPSDNQAFGNLLMKSLSRGGNLDEMRYWGGPAVESTAIGVQVGYQVRLRQHELRHCRRHA